MDLTKKLKELFETNNGGTFFKIKDQLLKVVNEASKEQIINALVNYAQNGKIQHARGMILPDLVNLVEENDPKYAVFFEKGLLDKTLAYWSIDGYLKTFGVKAYGRLLDLILDSKYDLELRAKAVKSISQHSHQCFDRDLPNDPGYWKSEELRLDEIRQWQQAGFPNGEGYVLPTRHAALDAPKNQFEKRVAKLDLKLKKAREEEQDMANPSNWLVIAEQTDLEAIKSKWRLPSLYLEFLTHFSPLRVWIEDDSFESGLVLFGAPDLIKRQMGYSFNPVTNSPISDWPDDFLVIATDGGDPFCLDLSRSDGTDAPVLWAAHGTGKWDFEVYAESFAAFLVSLTEE